MDSENAGAGMEMPRYRSHKVVWAIKIAAIEVRKDKSAIIAPADDGYAPFTTKPGWAERFTGSEKDNGYYIQYADGFASWSPTKAFVDGYSPEDESGSALIPPQWANESMRANCLSMALSYVQHHRGPETSKDEVIEIAGKFFAFIQNGQQPSGQARKAA
jgi:hypothetical protein